MNNRLLARAVALLLFALGVAAGSEMQQDDGATKPPEPVAPVVAPPAAAAKSDSRIFGIIPNYSSTSADSTTVRSMTVKEKFQLSNRTVVDPGAFFMTAFYSGIGQLSNQYPTFGQGMKGYGKRYGMMYVDVVSNEYLTRAIVPSIFKQDPRYFRLGEGSTVKRVKYSLSRLWLARMDNGKTGFNYGEILGSTAHVALSNYYYPKAERTGGNLIGKAAIAIAPDSFSNLLREFWPDIAKRMKRRKGTSTP